jgi:hypothetical protein
MPLCNLPGKTDWLSAWVFKTALPGICRPWLIILYVCYSNLELGWKFLSLVKNLEKIQ